MKEPERPHVGWHASWRALWRSPDRPHAMASDEQRLAKEWWVLLLLTVSMVGLCTGMQWGQAPGRVVYDQFQRWHAPAAGHQVVVIGIDDASLEELGGWPLPRRTYAQLLEKMADSGHLPKAIGFDLLFSEPRGDDAALAAQMQRHRVFLAVESSRQNVPAPGGTFKLPPSLHAAAQGVAHVNVSFENDGFLRGAMLSEGKLPHLALAVAGQSADRHETDRYRRFSLIDPEIGSPLVSIADALSAQFPMEIFKDKYVLIGAVAPSLGDHFPTIFSGLDGVGTPGVMLHASLLNDILDGHLIRPLSGAVQWALSVGLLVSLLLTMRVASPQAELAVAGGVVCLALGVSFSGLVWGHVWFDPGLSIMAIALLKPAWAWRRTEMVLRFMGERATMLQHAQMAGPESKDARVQRARFSSDTVQQYARLLDQAIHVVKERADFLHRIVSESPTALLVVDDAHRIVMSSPRLQDDTPAHLLQPGQAMAPWLGHLGLDPVPDLSSWTGQDHYASCTNQAGTVRHYMFRLAHLTPSQAPGYWVFSLADITDIRDAQTTRERTLQFLSHDMRTSVASIMALCKPGVSVGMTPETAAPILQHAQTLLSMMDDFIMTKLAEAPRYPLAELLLESLLDEAVFQVRDLAQQNQMRWVMDLCDADLFIRADHRLFTRMLVNVLGNAVRHGQVGSDIRISLRQGTGPAQAGEWALLCIENRVGPPGKTGSMTGPSVKGFGLGLAFVKTVVQKHDGQIQWAMPEQGGAVAKVHLRMPLADVVNC